MVVVVVVPRGGIGSSLPLGGGRGRGVRARRGIVMLQVDVVVLPLARPLLFLLSHLSQ